MGSSINIRSSIWVNRFVFLTLFIGLLSLAISCGYGGEDKSTEGRIAIRKVQAYKVPLGFSISTGISDYFYQKNYEENRKMVAKGWYAFKRPYLAQGMNLKNPFKSKSYRVVHRFTIEDEQRISEQEFRFIIDLHSGHVEPENNMARQVMRLN